MPIQAATLICRASGWDVQGSSAAATATLWRLTGNQTVSAIYLFSSTLTVSLQSADSCPMSRTIGSSRSHTLLTTTRIEYGHLAVPTSDDPSFSRPVN
ncbi:hypothetical protein L209DRAFT_759691 [Thermothelomyces heterothallicus CBS 203.75]